MARPRLRRLFGRVERLARQPRLPSRSRPGVEWLENRLVPATLRVGPNDSIQAAVNAAHPGDKIQVTGFHQEQVIISTDGITLKGANQSAIIQAPAVMTGNKAIVDVAGAHNVTIDGFTIQGPGGGMFDSIHYGIRVDSGGSATITHNHITHIHDSPLSGIQTGIGILVGRFAEGQTGSATISHNVIDDYQKAGIVVDNIGSSATIDHNTVVGVGPTPLIAQNGIQISRGANAQVDHNDVSGNLYAPQTTISTGILLFNPGTVSVGHNTVHANDVGIYAQSLVGFPGYGLAKVVLDHNEVSGSTFDGIDLDGITGAVVSHNEVSNSTQGNGIGLFDNSTGNTLDHNESENNGNDGIFVDAGSTGNTFSHNQMNGNGNLDAEDLSAGSGTAGTGNTWDHNQGTTSSPPGLLS